MRFDLFTIATMLTFTATIAHAQVTETFDSDHANWSDAASSPATFVPTGGPGGAGDGHISVSPIINSTFQATVFRGQDNLNSSGGAFVGDWQADGIAVISFDVRHFAAEPLAFFARIATPGNFPAHVALNFAPIVPGMWTHVEIPIHEGSINLVNESPLDDKGVPVFSYADTFTNVGKIQIGASALDGSQIEQGPAVFNLDNVMIDVPEPAAGALLLLAAGAVSMRRRGR